MVICEKNDALSYLHAAFEESAIEAKYGLYFAYFRYKAKVIDFKGMYPEAIPEELKEFKANLCNEFCKNYFPYINLENDDQNRTQAIVFQRFKELAVKVIALDKQTGVLHLITKNQNPGGSVWNPVILHSYHQIKISENPQENDWLTVDSTLDQVRNTHMQYFVQVLDGSAFSAVHGYSDSFNVNVSFLWQKHRREIHPDLRKLSIEKGWNPEIYQERQYLSVECNDTFQFIKSHGDETPSLLPNELFGQCFFPFDNNTPCTPNWIIIPFRDIVEIFKVRIPQVKSALSNSVL